MNILNLLPQHPLPLNLLRMKPILPHLVTAPFLEVGRVVPHYLFPLPLGHLVLPHPEAIQADFVNRLFIIIAIFRPASTPHLVASPRHPHKRHAGHRIGPCLAGGARLGGACSRCSAPGSGCFRRRRRPQPGDGPPFQIDADLVRCKGGCGKEQHQEGQDCKREAGASGTMGSQAGAWELRGMAGRILFCLEACFAPYFANSRRFTGTNLLVLDHRLYLLYPVTRRFDYDFVYVYHSCWNESNSKYPSQQSLVRRPLIPFPRNQNRVLQDGAMNFTHRLKPNKEKTSFPYPF